MQTKLLTLEELKKEAEILFEYEDMKGDCGCNKYEVLEFIEKVYNASRSELKERIEEKFESFCLQDWSGESEVYEEIKRLKNSIIPLLTEEDKI